MLVFDISYLKHPIQHQDKNILASLLQREAAAPTLFKFFGKIHFSAAPDLLSAYKINNLSRTCIKSKIP